MSDVPVPLRVWAVVVAVGAVVAFWLVATGYVPRTDPGEVVPMTVRDNPSSYRPSYGVYSGWRAPSSTGGGGFGFGK